MESSLNGGDFLFSTVDNPLFSCYIFLIKENYDTKD